MVKTILESERNFGARAVRLRRNDCDDSPLATRYHSVPGEQDARVMSNSWTEIDEPDIASVEPVSHAA